MPGGGVGPAAAVEVEEVGGDGRGVDEVVITGELDEIEVSGIGLVLVVDVVEITGGNDVLETIGDDVVVGSIMEEDEDDTTAPQEPNSGLQPVPQ